MFINYVALMLINLVASLALLAAFVYWGLPQASHKQWSPAFGIAGLVQFLCGFEMITHWPLPGSNNIAFGEMSVLIGALLLGAALAMALGWDLMPLTVYGTFAGLAAVVVGIRLFSLGMTRQPLVSAIGFVVPGLVGLLSWPGYRWRSIYVLRLLAALALAGSAALWAVTGYLAYWGHLADYAAWLPPTMGQ